MQIGRNRRLGAYLKVADWGTRTGSILIGALNKAPIDSATWLSPVLREVLHRAATGWLVPAALIVTPLVAWLRRKADKSRLDAVHDLLDTIRDHVFKHGRFDHEQHRRVTLFKYKGFCFRRWPWNQGWLVPLERSGKLTRRTTAIFRAPDDGEKCEGVAGKAWSGRDFTYVHGLPDLRCQPTDQDFAEYAEKSFIDVATLKKKPPQARSLCGTVLEVSGQPWGVLVIDSVGTELVTARAKTVFGLFSNALATQLKGL